MTVRLPYLDDPLLRLLPSEPPEQFLSLPFDEQQWRGRFFLTTWIMYGDERYAWAAALAPDPDGESRKAIATVSDALIVNDLRLINEMIAEADSGGTQ